MPRRPLTAARRRARRSAFVSPGEPVGGALPDPAVDRWPLAIRLGFAASASVLLWAGAAAGVLQVLPR